MKSLYTIIDYVSLKYLMHSPYYIVSPKKVIQLLSRDGRKKLAEYISDSDINHIADELYDWIFQYSIQNGDQKYATHLLEYNVNKITDETYTHTFQYFFTPGGVLRYYDFLYKMASNSNKLQQVDITKATKRSIYKLAREGKVDLLQSLSTKLDTYKITIAPKKNFFESTKEECFGEKTNLKNIKFDSEVKAIAQNFCSTMLVLKDDTILKIKGHEAPNVIDYLVESSLLHDLYQDSSTLTAYLNPNHAFCEIKYGSVHIAKGFGPLNAEYEARIVGYSIEESLYGIIAAASALVGYGITKAAITSSYYLPSTISILLSAITTTFVYYNYHNDISHVYPIQGELYDEFRNVQYSDKKNYPKLTLYLPEEQIAKAMQHISIVEESCKSSTTSEDYELCIYRAARTNCIAFVKDVCSAATGYDNVFRLFSPEQLSFLDEPSTTFYRQENQVPAYLYATYISENVCKVIGEGVGMLETSTVFSND